MNPPSSRRFNILQVVADQHQATCLGCEGHPQAITPNIDRLAAEGMRFTRAYTQNPTCTPSRVSFASGQYCHNHGFYAQNGPAWPELPSIFGHLKSRGYRTAAIGKIHLPDDPRQWLEGHVDLLGEYLHRQPNNAYHQWARKEGFFDAVDHRRIPELPGVQQHEARPSSLTFEQSVEGFSVAQACEFMDRCGDEPWMMEVSFFRPHQCYTPAKQFWDMYDEALDAPIDLKADQSHRAPHFRRVVAAYRAGHGSFEPSDFDSWARRVWRGYLASITHCDHALGLLLQHLKKTGLADRTVVLYHSDHGAYSGKFGVPEKAPGICSEAVCRIPMIWRVPGITPAGSVCDELVEAVDLPPTFCALSGVEPMGSCDASEITSLLRGGKQPVRRVAVTENVWSKALRWDNWRFVHYQPELFAGQYGGELYDVQEDPLERRNLFGVPEFRPIVATSRQLLLEWLIRTTRVRSLMMPAKPGDPNSVGMLAGDGRRDNRYGPNESLARDGVYYL